MTPAGGGGRVLVIGEALIDIVETDAGTTEHVGGSPANVALGLGRLGVPVDLLTRLGDDERGRRIAAHLDASGARIDPRSWSQDATSTSHARIEADGSARYTFDVEWEVPSPVDTSDADVVHAGSLALFLEPGGSAVADAIDAAAARATVSIDPNIRGDLLGSRAHVVERFERVAARAHLVKLSDEDAAWLYPGVPLERVIERICARGAAAAVLTRGARGAIGRSGGDRIAVAAASAAVVDTIGAGDAYMASLIASTSGDATRAGSAADLAFAMERAAVAAALTVGRAGAHPPTRAELDAAMDERPSH